MVAGRVVRFDGSRGYGFIAPDDGTEDVFLHVNDLLIPEQQVRPGLAVEFDVEEGDRGLKASAVKLAAARAGGAVSFPVAARQPDGDDSLCDVLTPDEYLHEVTEILLAAAPTLTGAQILQVRLGLLRFGRNHGWTED
ncbi:cold-shock protein [Streptomyces sp. NPDC003388]|uniref:cold-shock protein n=1 Tax=unclassified Streptomyces TaxID=2593676 RepID=UPI00117F12C3|nr:MULTISPECIES: cold shock domain-containing protein [unclassified Streptomyces]MDI1456253.1 cold shock domain-containing protein [Streptomyces sp. ATE26]